MFKEVPRTNTPRMQKRYGTAALNKNSYSFLIAVTSMSFRGKIEHTRPGRRVLVYRSRSIHSGPICVQYYGRFLQLSYTRRDDLIDEMQVEFSLFLQPQVEIKGRV